jgi:RNA polymerase sigma factor (sigma-70 family)
LPDERLTVFVVDDDPSIRDSLALMLGIAGYRTSLFADAEAFLAACSPAMTGCLVADLRLPGKSGLELQAELRERGLPLPVVMITAHGDVPAARAAFHAQAVDFLEKPFDQKQLCAAIDAAFAIEEKRAEREQTQRADREMLARLTPREREVLDAVALGLHAKEIAALLEISPRTVEVHKTRIMEKLGARNAAELVRFSLAGSGKQ